MATTHLRQQQQRQLDLVAKGLCRICGKKRGKDGTTIRCRRCADIDKNRKGA